MGSIYNAETTLQIILDKGSLLSASKNIAKGFNTTFSGMAESFQKGKVGAPDSIYDYEGPGAGIAEGVGKIASGGKGGVIMEEGGKDTSSKQNLKLLGKIAAGIGIVAGFWMAIGPILSPFVKLIGALFLILLMPFIKAIMPAIVDNLPMIVEKVKGVAEGITDILNWFQKNFGTTGSLIAAIAGLLVLNAVVSMATGAITGALGLFITKGGALLPAVFNAAISLISGGLTALATALGVSVGAAGLIAVITIAVVWLGLVTLSNFLDDVDARYKAKQDFLDKTNMTEIYTVTDPTTGKQVQSNVDVHAETFRPREMEEGMWKYNMIPPTGPVAPEAPSGPWTSQSSDYSTEGQMQNIQDTLGKLPFLGDIFNTTVSSAGKELDSFVPTITDASDSLDLFKTSSDDLKLSTDDLKGTGEYGFEGLKGTVDGTNTSLSIFKGTIYETIIAMGNALRQAQMAAQQASISAASSASTLQNIKKQSTYSGGYFNR